MIKDLIFSYFFVFIAVILAGYGLKLFYIGNLLNFIILILISIYLFGIGCMGINRLKQYQTGCFSDKTHK